MLRKWLWRLGLIGVLSGLLATPAFAQMIATNLDLPRDPGTVEVELAWPQPTRCEVKQTAEELVLRFDQPVDYDVFRTLAPRIATWVNSASFGYDSMVLQLTPGTRAAVTGRDGKVVLTLTANLSDVQANPELPQTATPTATATAPPSARDRLLRLKAELLWTMGDAWEASELLAQLAQDKPNNVELLAVRSVVETRLGRWRLASADLDKAARLQGLEGRGDLPARGSEHAPRVETTYLHDRIDGGVGRDGVRTTGHAFLLPGLRLTLSHEIDRFLYPSFPHDSGLDMVFTAGLRQDFQSGSWLALKAKSDFSQVGVVAEGGLWDPWGGTRLTATWHELFKDLAGFLGYYGWRDAVGATRTLRSWSDLGRTLHGDITGQIGIHLERWTNPNDTGPVSDLLGLASLRYVSWYAKPHLSVTYSAQHVQILEHEPVGGKSPFPDHYLASLIVRNQIHVLTLGAQLPLWRWLSVDALGGYAVSVWGEDAAQFGGGLAWQPPTGFRAAVRYQRGMVPGGYGAVSSNLAVTAGGAF